MKNLPYIIIIALILFIVFRPAKVEHVAGEVIRDTIITNHVDTIRDTVPVPVYESVVDSFPFVAPVPAPGDTVRDTVYCLLRRKSTKTAFIRLMCRATGQGWIVSRCTVKRGLCLSESGQSGSGLGWECRLDTVFPGIR